MLSGMDLAELQVFLTVASERSFSKAAARLHRTQPAVSQAIRRLEDHLGERLFDRAAKDGKLTEAGRVLLDYAQRLMRLAEEADSAVRELRDLQRGRVLVGANEASPARKRVLRLFEQRQEQLNITLALPSLDGIKRAVEMDLGVALL